MLIFPVQLLHEMKSNPSAAILKGKDPSQPNTTLPTLLQKRLKKLRLQLHSSQAVWATRTSSNSLRRAQPDRLLLGT